MSFKRKTALNRTTLSLEEQTLVRFVLDQRQQIVFGTTLGYMSLPLTNLTKPRPNAMTPPTTFYESFGNLTQWALDEDTQPPTADEMRATKLAGDVALPREQPV